MAAFPGAYPAAGLVARHVKDHLAGHVAEARSRGVVTSAPVPEVGDIEAMVDAAFWVSLRREETASPKVSLAYLPAAQAVDPLKFEYPLPLDVAALTRVAPAVERAGIHLGVWKEHGALVVWGMTRSIPAYCLVLEVAAPGLLVIKHHRGNESGKFVNIAVLEGDQVKIVDERATSLPDCPDLLTWLLGFDSPASWVDSPNVLVQLAVSMREHGRGGLALVVPAGSEAWRESIVRPIPYGLDLPFSPLANLVRLPDDQRGGRRWREAVDRAVDAIAGVTAVDGATVLTNQYELLAFGAKITRRQGGQLVERVALTEPIQGSVPLVTHPAQLGGTRHLSAAQFVQDQGDGLALVASQDGRFTVFAWSPCDEIVHAHRVDALLL
jgi:hypothetical protein